MASIRKRDGKWQVQVRRQGHRPLSKTFLSRADAALWARTIETKLDHNELPPDIRGLRSSTVADLLKRYRLEISPLKRGHDIEAIRLGKLQSHWLARVTLDRLSPVEIARYRDSRLKEVSGDTVRRELGLMRHVIETARKEWNVPLRTNPVADVQFPSPNPGRTRRLSSDEATRLKQALGVSRNRALGALLACAIETGMRRGELLAATWQNFDPALRLLLLPMTKNGRARYVPLSDAAITAIESMRGCDIERIFPITGNALRLAWNRLMRRAGIANLRFHDLRHEAISRLFEKGLTLPEVALVSGHRDTSMLLRYAHAGLQQVLAKL